MSTMCERCIVSGKVQGVFFRASAKQQAEKFGLTGYAKNLADGHVEVLICGEPAAVGHMKAWLWQGPLHAHVADVKCTLVEMVPPLEFSVL